MLGYLTLSGLNNSLILFLRRLAPTAIHIKALWACVTSVNHISFEDWMRRNGGRNSKRRLPFKF